ncbi:unnamed protein product [Knipowitschia caucasica]|uniref:L1 transposable element RRM domain-containing protein n=2 Tax=Knipowitschia caucasica TaxID=637954 RepID=A0AAV2KZ87_KNICA
MPPKSGKSQVSNPEASKSGTPKANSPAPEANTATIDANMLQAFRDIVKEVIREENDGLREEISRAIAPIHKVLDDCTDKLRDHGQELFELDTRVTATEANYTELSNKYDKLVQKLDDIENRGRRCNLRLLNINEGLEQGDPTKFVADLLHEVLGGPNGLEKPPILDRAHRTSAQPSAAGGRPRPLIVRFHYYQEKERIQRLAREKGRLEFRGNPLLIFPDFSAELNRRRSAFNEVKALLRGKDRVRYGLLYPARLRVSWDGETKVFDNPKSVKDYIDSKV